MFSKMFTKMVEMVFHLLIGSKSEVQLSLTEILLVRCWVRYLIINYKVLSEDGV